MKNSSRWVPAYVVVLLVAAGILGTLTQGDAAPVQTTLHPSERDTLPDIVGTWTGTWEDTIYQWAFGTLEWTITQNRQELSATGTIGMGAFGMGDKTGTASGGITARPPGSMISFTFSGTDVGSGTGAIAAGGVASGEGSVTAPLSYGDFTFQGTVTGNTMRGTFDFLSPSGGAGKGYLTRDTPVEATSWGEIKARFRDDN